MRGFLLSDPTTRPYQSKPQISNDSQPLPGIPCNIHATRQGQMFRIGSSQEPADSQPLSGALSTVGGLKINPR
jgi:hypothetical protein